MDVFIPNETKPTGSSRSKSVRFFKEIKVKRVEPYYEYDDDEYDATWYSEEELHAVVVDCLLTCQKMAEGEPVLEEEGECIRGLEYKTPSGSRLGKKPKPKPGE